MYEMMHFELRACLEKILNILISWKLYTFDLVLNILIGMSF